MDQPDYKATAWRPTAVGGKGGWEMCQHFTWIGGKWEGGVSIRPAVGPFRQMLIDLGLAGSKP